MRARGLQQGLRPPSPPRVSHCTRCPLIRLPSRLAATSDPEAGSPAPSSPQAALLWKNKRATSGGGGQLARPRVNTRVHAHVHAQHERARSAQVLLLQVSDRHPDVPHSTRPGSFLISPVMFSRPNISSCFSFETACCCLTFPVSLPSSTITIRWLCLF